SEPTAVTPPPPSGDTRRLTDEQRQEILDNLTEEQVTAARNAAAHGELPGSNLDRGIHGEIGAMIGSHGSHSVFGTAAIPLGDSGGAIVSFEDSRFGYRR